MVSLITGVLVAVPTGMLSDKLGRKPFILVGLLFLSVGVGCWGIVQGVAGIWTAGLNILQFLFTNETVFISGVGAGMYPSVETALCCDVIPSNIESGKFFGEFNFAGQLGQIFGQFGVGILF